jgi:hypothetical protein
MAAGCLTKSPTGCDAADLAMTDHGEKPSTSDATPPQFVTSVERWRNGLARITGCSAKEIALRIDVLLEFCAEHGLSSERMIEECRSGPDRLERRTFYLSAARNSNSNLVVQSFLVHNGINVFGELICMPNTVDGVVQEQGSQWVSKRSYRNR